ncbi:hypothetical protein NEPAR06_0088 [Nematocida parisii]|uniref:t-SNARE coiled-coil homology domain-containing protein n=1 Tax=Nematocida parisii (strain ERTm3) TaxID=935791 RepID=I3EE60_NEMP3|nr:uncharacterized protein NEPG_00111 [Nematocida parisii ERTm1]EIJ87507.1 hypothetical protein NEQG_02388 [Nematocida parisii ERTm3]KAI5130080.1 hypothetical protein NEPAR08_1846 [Nematocida parisii]EIJ94589.1 hypothetical protein NEPG_00111 [Nematocida parisii ERTm1]KAI5130475.1 hypothetical protein NEPAR03_2093 [Nematocida parisii]KAI5142778.1 hypothetical protein NEPAR07_0304 [Nematocida parisii]|eukprot:XP_013057945.1 hypothetical protein NEPG_00111 [Nematocida parisii ERTm1]
MRNRSEELKRRRGILYEKRRIKEKTEVEVLFGKISENLSKLEELVISVEKECSIYCIPSFESKGKTIAKIEQMKYEISIVLTKSKGILDYFSQNFKKSINYTLVESISVHFHYKIDRLINRMNASMANIEKIKEPSTEQKSTNGAESVYKSVYHITELIRELKTVVISQSDKIERLDIAMDYVSNSANKSVNEIANISVFGSHIKNRIISVLFSCIFVLVVLSTLKAYSHSMKYTRTPSKPKITNQNEFTNHRRESVWQNNQKRRAIAHPLMKIL